MKVFHASWNDPETVFHKMPWKKNFTEYPSFYRSQLLKKKCQKDIFLGISFNILQLQQAVTRGVLQKKLLLKIPQNSQENNCIAVSFLIKLRTSGLQLY